MIDERKERLSYCQTQNVIIMRKSGLTYYDSILCFGITSFLEYEYVLIKNASKIEILLSLHSYFLNIFLLTV